VAQTKVGINSNALPALELAFLWWLGLPEQRPRAAFPRNPAEMALECNRQRGSDLMFVRENYGYIFAYSNQAAALALTNIAAKAGLTVTNF
jgi:hypothetical protein